MNIGIVTPRYPPNSTGGGGISAQLLANVLSSCSTVSAVTVYAFDGDGPNQDGDITIKRYDAPYIHSFEVINIYSYGKLQTALQEDDIDILHAYNMKLHPITGYLSDRYSIPAVATLNSYVYIPNDKIGIPVHNPLQWYKKIFRATTGRVLCRQVRKIDSFIAISNTIKEIYLNDFLVGERIDVIPNMCEPRFWNDADSGSEAETTSDQCNILYVGSLRETKGVEYLIRSASHLPDRFQISIAGGGDNKSNLESLAVSLSVQQQVDFLGYVDHESIPALYDRSDIFVHPGIWPEPFGRTILEAMQFSLPVVATNLGGPAEVIPQEECLCDPADHRDMAEKIIFVDERKEQIGEHNRQYVDYKYSPESVVPKIIDVYERVRGTSR